MPLVSGLLICMSLVTLASLVSARAIMRADFRAGRVRERGLVRALAEVPIVIVLVATLLTTFFNMGTGVRSVPVEEAGLNRTESVVVQYFDEEAPGAGLRIVTAGGDVLTVPQGSQYKVGEKVSFWCGSSVDRALRYHNSCLLPGQQVLLPEPQAMTIGQGWTTVGLLVLIALYGYFILRRLGGRWASQHHPFGSKL